jgi:hypothetical protein
MTALSTQLIAGILVALFASVLLLLVTHLSKPGVRWSMAWNILLGVWLLAPHLLGIHRLVPHRVAEWVTLDLGLVAMFALFGLATFAPPSAILSAGWLAVRRRDDPGTFVALGMGALVPATYVTVAALIEYAAFGRVPGFAPYVGLWPRAVAVYAVWCAVLSALAFATQAGRVRLRPTLIRSLLTAGIAIGLLSLPWRLTALSTDAAAAAPSPVALQRAHPQTTPLLIIGLDSGNWRSLKTVMERGNAPTLAGIAARGISGDIHALWPPFWSTPAWGSIITGYSRDEIGVYEDFSVSAGNLPRFDLPLSTDLLATPIEMIELAMARVGIIEPIATPREALRQPPFWERTSAAGVSAGILRFHFTYPADSQAGIVVSNRTGNDAWSLLPVRPPSTGLASPEAARLGLDRLFYADLPDEAALLHELLPELNRPKPRDANVDPAEMLKIAVGIDEHTILAAQTILREQPNIDMLAIYFGGFDGICHQFWQYRFPEDYADDPPDPDDVRALGPIIDRYVAYLDRRLATVVAAFPRTPNTLVVSDHGHEAATVSSLWRGWHGPDGIFMAAGPDVGHEAQAVSVTYYDIVPTILDLLGFEKPRGLRGHSVLPMAGGSR